MARTLVDPSIPTELLLEIIEHLPFDRTVMRDVSLVHPRLRSVVSDFQRSVTKTFARSQLRHAATDFPCDQPPSYRWLARCIHRYDVVDDVMATLVSKVNRFAVQRHNMGVTNAGLLLLYRILDIAGMDEKIAFIKSLPRSPLLAIFLAVHFSVLTARYHGKGIINQQRYGRFLDGNQLEMRHEVEFCFAEGAMELGPQFILDTFLSNNNAEKTLLLIFHDHAIQDWNMDTVQSDFTPIITHGPHREPGTRSHSLWTTVQERLADVIDSPLMEVVGRIMDEVEAPNHWLAWISLGGKAQIMEGLDVTLDQE